MQPCSALHAQPAGAGTFLLHSPSPSPLIPAHPIPPQIPAWHFWELPWGRDAGCAPAGTALPTLLLKLNKTSLRVQQFELFGKAFKLAKLRRVVSFFFFWFVRAPHVMQTSASILYNSFAWRSKRNLKKASNQAKSQTEGMRCLIQNY